MTFQDAQKVADALAGYVAEVKDLKEIALSFNAYFPDFRWTLEYDHRMAKGFQSLTVVER